MMPDAPFTAALSIALVGALASMALLADSIATLDDRYRSAICHNPHFADQAFIGPMAQPEGCETE